VAVKLETLERRALVEYDLDEANPEIAYPYSPARATAAIAKRYGYPKSRLIPIVAEVYYAANGVRSPLPKSATKGRKSLASAVRKRRDAGGRLGRWEVVAYSTAATLGRPVSVAAVRALFREAGGDEAKSYTGTGTRKGAPETRTDEVAELTGSLGAGEEA
jgi:hypothetical protein